MSSPVAPAGRITGQKEAGQIVRQAKAANPAIAIIARAHSDDEAEHLAELGAGAVITGEREIARGIIDADRLAARFRKLGRRPRALRHFSRVICTT